MSALWDPIFGSADVAAITDDRAWLRTLCETEAGLARVCAKVGLIDPAAAAAVEAACTELAETDPAELESGAATDGNPVVALVSMLRERVGDPAADAVHLGATSQDIVDTALMQLSRRAIVLIVAGLDNISAACVQLARTHRDTPMVARTLLQQAVPTTFGAVVAGWGDGIDRARVRLVEVELAVQYGGAAGTLATVYPHGPSIRAALAIELGLVDPGVVWHTERTRIAELAAALGSTAGAVAKIATDIVLLAQTEVGELHELRGGRSSAMPHKQNPIAAITARASAARTPGLVSTLLAAMPAELQRGAGPWHTEWLPLIDLLRATGGAGERLRASLAGVQVDPAAMRANLERLHEVRPDLRPEAALGDAVDAVDRYLARHPL